MLRQLKVDIILNETCNMNCTYCFDKNKQDSFISNENVLLLFDELEHFIEQHKELNSIIFTIFGGEITINEEKLDFFLKIFLNFLSNIKIKSRIIITTNGFLYSLAIENFIKKSNKIDNIDSYLAVSIGLSKQDHSITRGNNYNIIKNNIIKYFKNTQKRVIKKSVITPYILENFDDFLIGFDELKKYTILNWFFIDDGKDVNIDKFKEFLDKLKHFYIDTLNSSDFISFGSDRFIREIVNMYYRKIKSNTYSYFFSNNTFLNICVSPNKTFHSSHLSYFYRLDSYLTLNEIYNNKNNLIRSYNRKCEKCFESNITCDSIHIENSIFLEKNIEINKNVCLLNNILNEFVYEVFKEIYLKKDNLKKYKAFELYNTNFFKNSNLTLYLKEIYKNENNCI